jgi:hypothetical protein
MSRSADVSALDGIQIGFYENWMFDQIITMFVDQYGSDRHRQTDLFRQFYEAPFQREQGIRLVAIDGETVCGFQSYFYWPYVYQGRTLRTFQSGNSLVAPAYRGRQIFARLLNYLNCLSPAERPQIECLMGFPVEMSYGSFLRNQWSNPLDLHWYIRPIHPLSIVRPYTPLAQDWHFETPAPVDPYYPDSQIVLSKDQAFVEWRRTSRAEPAGYLYQNHADSRGRVRFELKANRRGRINELVLGDVVRSSPDPQLLVAALRTLIRSAGSHPFVTMLSVALNDQSSDRGMLRALRRNGFFKVNRSIHFIAKSIGNFPESTMPDRWTLLRSDIDTW